MTALNMHWEQRVLVKDPDDADSKPDKTEYVAMVTRVDVLNWAVFMRCDTGWEFAQDEFATEDEAKRYAEVRGKLERGGQ